MQNRDERHKGYLFAALAFLILMAGASCGGGELPDEALLDPNPDISNLLPVAVIAADPINAAYGETVSLDGSGSYDPDGDEIATFSWSQTSGEPIEISGADEAEASFVAPGTPTVITIQLIVTDSAGNSSAPAIAEITVTEDGLPPDDGEQLTAVYVSGTMGNDANSGSPLRPVATIGRGILIAAANGLSDIFVMEGTYEEEIALQGGLDLRGCAASWDEEGDVTYAASNAGTIVKAPAGAAQAMTADGISDTSVRCFSIEGGSAPLESRSILITDSQGIALLDLSFVTPGSAGGLCRDVDVQGSETVSISSSAFRNSGECDDYIAVSVGASQGVEMDALEGPLAVAIEPGNESYLKAFQAVDSDSVVFRGVAVAGSAPLSSSAVFTGVALGDTTGAVVEDNSIDVQGTSASAGVSLRCTAQAVHYTVAGNTFSLEDVAGSLAGVRINCPMPGGTFDIERNRFRLVPAANTEMETTGVDVQAQMKPLNVSVVNNIFTMTLAPSDHSDKTGIELTNLNAASNVSAMHNTFIIMGSQGELHTVGSDSSDVQFDSLGNIAFVYGNNVKNSLFRLRKACQTNFCARGIVANLVNEDFFATPLLMAYYYDTAENEALEVINECDLAMPPPQCGTSEVDRRDNQINAAMIVPFFDTDAGELMPDNQPLAKDLGPLGTGVAVDVDGKERSDSLPDIGATEY
ncbi:MAG: hypothetical protein JXA24_04955 [Proteobacteria bacterium]|nr:hypothetical protein [Pseudomonadota bacterium]